MRLILVRHGETPWNREGRFQGQSTVGLSERGQQQARRVAAALKALKPKSLYSSPLPRTMMTAQEISKEVSLSITPVDALKEVSLGELEGITGQEMRTRYAEIYAAWREDPSDVVFPGGESMRELQERAWGAVRELLNRHGDDVLVAVSHNFAIRVILCRFLGLPLAKFHMLRVDLASMSIIQANSRSSHILTLNDRCHLVHDRGEGHESF